jgi:hypothetical protein
MTKNFIFALFAALFIAPAVCATSIDEMETKVDDLCSSLVEIEGMRYPELGIHDILERVANTPDIENSIGDLLLLSQVDAEADALDATLIPYFHAYKLLYVALTQPIENYLVELKAYKRTKPSANFLKVADVENLLENCDKCPPPCATCNGTKKCTSCKGRGKITERATSALGSSTQRKCSTCAGSGRCKSCQKSPDVCSTCKGRKRVINEALLYDRILAFVKRAHNQSAILLAEPLKVREQTKLLAADIRKINSSTFSSTDPERVLEVLDALPPERQMARTWNYVSPLREVAIQMRDEKAFMSPEKVRMRDEIKSAIENAHLKTSAEASLECLLTPMERCKASEQYEMLETVYAGYVKQWQRERTAQVDELQTRFETIKEIPSADERCRKLELFLKECKLPDVAYRVKTAPMYEDLKATDEAMLQAASTLQTKVKTALEQADAERIEAEKEAQPDEPVETSKWWLWPVIIGGVIAILYFAFSVIQTVNENKKKRAKEAQRQATLASIRSTFARSHKNNH